jgi:pimeloyl-ACP methyl ester carboxylesterase
MSKAKSSGKVRTTRSISMRDSHGSSPPPTVSGKWLLTAGAIAIAGALLCAWATLCILFWQGSWQLLYHPTSSVTRTPASVNLTFDSVGFATNASGEPQLRGWWIPATAPARFTAAYLHGADGNLGDTVNALARLHRAGLNVFAFDYRGYGQSHFAHPSEERWREDAGSAIEYLTETRHIPANTIVLVGKGLGANLALEVAAARADLAGVVLEEPLESPTVAIFSDARAHLVPAHLLASDRWQTTDSAGNLLIPSLWFYWTTQRDAESEQDKPEAYEKVPARKMLVWLTNSPDKAQKFESALRSWIDQLPAIAH